MKRDAQSIRIANSLPQSPAATAPSSEGAKGWDRVFCPASSEQANGGFRGAFRPWCSGPPAAFLSTFRRWKVDERPTAQARRGPRFIKPPRSPLTAAPCGMTPALAGEARFAGRQRKRGGGPGPMRPQARPRERKRAPALTARTWPPGAPPNNPGCASGWCCRPPE